MVDTPETIPKGTQIGETECPSCGAALPVKVNAAGCVYFFCAKVIGTNADTGKPEKCFTRFNWGRAHSRKMINEYLKTQKDNENDSTEDKHREENSAGNAAEPEGRKDFEQWKADRADRDDTGHDQSEPPIDKLARGVKHFFS